MKFIDSSIKALIFDLGGVIINLSYQKTFDAFANLSKLDLKTVEQLIQHDDTFKLFEQGKIDEYNFYQKVNSALQLNINKEIFDEAWNAMLLDLPQERLNVLSKLRFSYKVFLLSNTNVIHLRALYKQLHSENQVHDFDAYFDKAYYSHIIKLRKPDRDIFDFVLNEQSLKANEVIFFDDILSNIEGAAQAGLHTFHVNDANELFEKLDKFQ